MTTTPAISVVVCTHNPRPDYFRRTLDALRAQTLARDKWELLVIDNASREPLSKRLDLSWHAAARVVREDRLGLTPARLNGIRAAQGELLVFVDDDNVLDADYLEVALKIESERRFLGSWSGQCRPHFEQTPPEWTRRYWGNLAIRQFVRDTWSNLPRLAETMPCGAGMCVRRAVARHYLNLNESGKRSMQYDRTGTSLLSGGDNDLAACACDLGLGVGLVASLNLTHLIPSERLTGEYLARLADGIAYSSVLLDFDRGIENPPRRLAGQIMDFIRLLRLGGPHRRVLAAAYQGRDRAIAYILARNRCLIGKDDNDNKTALSSR